jgi:HEAT repeat protein
MKNYKKFDYIQQIKKKLTKYKHQLIEFSRDDDPIIRLEAIRTLGLCYDGDIDKAILYRLKDVDELVKTEALDNISLPLNRKKVLKKIAKLLDDESFLVKSYAVNALAWNRAFKYKKQIKKLLKLQNDELNVSIYAALILLGEDKYLKNLLMLLEHDNYQIRCAVTNMLYDIVKRNNVKLIFKKLKKAYKKEKSRAVKSCLETLIEELKKNYSI